MKRYLLAFAASLAVLGIPSAANAEVLTVEGLTPAASPALSSIETLAIDRFGGSDGQALAFELEDVLTSVSVFDQPYFDVIGGRSAVDPDATLTGNVTTGIDEYETVETRSRCVERDDKKKCVKRRDIKVDCLRRVIDFRAQVRASRFSDGRSIYAESFPQKDEQTICFGDDEEFASSEGVIRKIVADTARELRRDFAPREYRRDIRVLESRKGMAKADSKYFKAAVKMTKSNQTEACRMWDEAAANGLLHMSLTFNRGLCAEMRGDLGEALILYGEARSIEPKKTEIREAIDRVLDHQQALDDWEARKSNALAQTTAKQG